jgi:surface polysaccharide O-acyltransferase-like enzyme
MANSIRFREIDSLRGLAVLLMVMVHAAATWNPSNTSQSSTLAYIVAGLGGLAAPLFVTIFGWGMYKSKSPRKAILIKAGILLILQYVVNLCSPQLYDPFSPGILSLFAILLIAKPVIMKTIYSFNNILIFNGLIIAMFIINNSLFEFQGSNNWDARITVNDAFHLIKLALFTGTYPLFPWISFCVVGAFLGRFVTEGEKTLPRNNTIVSSIIVGISYCIVTLYLAVVNSKVWAHPSRGDYLNFFPANLGFMIAAATGVLILWLIVQELDILLFEQAGKVSLTVYVAHFIPLTYLSNLEDEGNWTIMEASQAVILFTTTWLLFAYFCNRYQWLTIEHLIGKLTVR